MIQRQGGAEELRPGGSVSGPVLRTLAHVALYVALLGDIQKGRSVTVAIGSPRIWKLDHA